MKFGYIMQYGLAGVVKKMLQIFFDGYEMKTKVVKSEIEIKKP